MIGMVALIILLGWSPIVASAEKQSARHAPLRPNIVIVLVDDMGYSDIGAFGGEIDTPNIDRLAARGVKFTEFYNAARCWPSRAALMSGRHQHAVGLGGELQFVDDKGRVSPPPGTPRAYQGYYRFDVPTLAERLRSLGYATYATGKWHLGDVDRASWPTRRGFDHYFGPVTGTDSYFSTGVDPARPRRYVDDEAIWPVPARGFYATDAFTRKAATYVDAAARARDRPFFLYLAYTAPHWPLHALPSDIQRQKGAYAGGWDDVRARRFVRQRASGIVDSTHQLPPRPADIPAWEDVPDKPRWSMLMETYAAQIAAVDRGVGELVATLRRNGQLDNTIILFLSDNGATDEDLSQRPSTPRFNNLSAPQGSRERFESYSRNWAHVSNTPYRQYKSFMGEGGIRTPLIVAWPDGIARPGRISRQVGHVIDIAPTLVDLATPVERRPRDRERWSDGESLKHDIMSSRRPRSRRLFFEHMGNQAMREGDWKIVKDAGDPWRLYDLARDPTELRDLAAERPAIVRGLVRKWARSAHELGVRDHQRGLGEKK